MVFNAESYRPSLVSRSTADHDRDADGVFSGCDNCPTIRNPGQEDADGDGTGDACELLLDFSAARTISHCGTATMDVQLTSDCPVEGISFGIAHDPLVLAALALEALPVWGGEPPGYIAVNLEATGVGGACAKGARGITVAMVGSPANPSARLIPPDLKLSLALVTYAPAPESRPGSSSRLDIVGCLVAAPDSPPAAVRITCNAQSRTPAVGTPGSITLTEGNCRKRGLCNGDDLYDISDAIAVLSFLFSGGATPPCLQACDCDGDGNLVITDGICFLDHLFRGGSAPRPARAACE